MSKKRFVTAMVLLSSLGFGVGIYIFQIYAGFVANCYFKIFIILAQVSVLIFSCLNMIHVETQKKCNEKFMKDLGLKFAEDLYNKGEDKE